MFKMCRLVKNKTSWYVEFWQTDPKTLKLKRFRRTDGMNRIKDKGERYRRAQLFMEAINRKLPEGYPFSRYLRKLTGVNAVEALNMARNRKNKHLRDTSKSSNKHIEESFIAHLFKLKVDEYAIEMIQEEICKAWVEKIDERNLVNITVNNYVTRMKVLFGWLKDSGYIHKNPFDFYVTRREGKRKRRALSEREQRLIIKYVEKHEPTLLLGIILQFYMAIRPQEMRRLRVRDLDIERGLIRISGEQSKTNNERTVTIPNECRGIMRHLTEGVKQNNYLFGRGGKIGGRVGIGRNNLYRRHKNVLKKLLKRGKLKNIEGITFYSWKDSGALILSKKISLPQLMRHLGHTSLNSTQRYVQSIEDIDRDIRDAEMGLL